MEKQFYLKFPHFFPSTNTIPFFPLKKKVSLSMRAEKVLEETLLETKSDVMYFWAHLDMDGGFAGSYNELTFWSLCDILNGGYCRYSR